MGRINWFKTYLQEIQTAISGINSNRMVIDDSQLTTYLNAHDSGENAILIGVLPDFGSNATDGDTYKQRATTQLMVLEKTAYSEHDYDSFYDIFDRTEELANAVVLKLLTDSLNGCNNLRFLNAASIQVVPVWNKAGCNGWNILFNFDLDITA